MAETFTFEDEERKSLTAFARLDTMITVVDGSNFLRDYRSADSLQTRGGSLGEQDGRSAVDLLVDQIEFCDVLRVNRTDLMSKEEQVSLRALLHSLNPRAQIVTASFVRCRLKRC